MIQRVIEIVHEASKYMYEDIEVKQKGNDSNFVTTADVNVQKYLEKHLQELLPESRFIGEEDEELAEIREYMWVVDPIDGTSNFIRGIGASVVSVGLMKAGKPYLGVIYDPYRKETFWAERGKGMFLNGTKVTTSDRDFRHALLGIAASVYNKDLAGPCFRIMERVYAESDDFRRFGAAALEMAYLAAGRLDIYFEMRLFPWDMAAGLIMIEEAGGAYELLFEDDLPLDRPAGIIAANNEENLAKLRKITYEEIPEKLY